MDGRCQIGRKTFLMIQYITVALLIFTSASAQCSQAQASADKSFYLGKLVEHPEALSGIWETSDGHGGAVGIHLVLDTTVPGTATSLHGVPQAWQDLLVSIFDRRGSEIQVGEENSFSDSKRGGGVRLENGRLTLHFVAIVPNTPSVDLDLVKRPGGGWAGRLHRGWFDAKVVLRRPGVVKPNPVVGTWLGGSAFLPVCMHVTEITPGEFTGWSDSLQVLDRVGMAPNVARPATALQHYGELMKVGREADSGFSFEFFAYTAICCSHTFVGLLQANGSRIDGIWPPGPNQSPRKASWKKMRGNSCIAKQGS